MSENLDKVIAEYTKIIIEAVGFSGVPPIEVWEDKFAYANTLLEVVEELEAN